MKNASIKLSLIGLTLCSGISLAQQKIDFGKREFETNCASCHGISGKGNGILVEHLRKSPPDLTLLAKNNQGVLPMNRLYEVIEGANVPAHGSRDMPVWGRDYRIKDAEYYVDVPYDAPGLVRARILALLEYLNRLQVK
jgi:mono/diheme cytochrome c family protein